MGSLVTWPSYPIEVGRSQFNNSSLRIYMKVLEVENTNIMWTSSTYMHGLCYREFGLISIGIVSLLDMTLHFTVRQHWSIRNCKLNVGKWIIKVGIELVFRILTKRCLYSVTQWGHIGNIMWLMRGQQVQSRRWTINNSIHQFMVIHTCSSLNQMIASFKSWQRDTAKCLSIFLNRANF